jgi:rubrerythrin
MENQERIKACPMCGGEVLLSYLNDWRYKFQCKSCYQYFELNAPTQSEADRIYNEIIASNKHSKWEISFDGYYPYCRECGYAPEGGKLTKFCPRCGARMDGDIDV